MWFTLDPGSIIENMDHIDSSKKTSIVFDVPSNMETLEHKSNDTLQIKFFYYAGGSETVEQVVLQNAYAEVGTSSKRLFTITAKNVGSIKHGIKELILGCSKQRTETGLRACYMAIQNHENSFNTKRNNGIVEITKGQKIEKVLLMFDRDTLESCQTILETASNLEFSNVQQLSEILSLVVHNMK